MRKATWKTEGYTEEVKYLSHEKRNNGTSELCWIKCHDRDRLVLKSEVTIHASR